MGCNLKTYTVEELVKLGALEKPLDGNHGGIHPKSSEFVAEGIPFIMASDMKNGKIDTRNCKFISEDQARGLRKGFAKEGDVLLSHKATIGRTAIVDRIDTDFIVLTPQVTYYRIKDLGVINPKYLKYYFDSVKFQSLFEQWAGGGSTRLYLGITGQMKLPIELPDIKTQNSIASIISDYDSKLLLNRQTNQTLEQMAQALFKSWFVDFDPVFDNLLASVDFRLENLENRLPDELKQKAQHRLAALDSLKNAAQCKASLSALAHELQTQIPTQAAEQVSEKAAETPVKADFNANPKILAQHANTHAHFPNEFEHNEQLGWIPKGWDVGVSGDLVDVRDGTHDSPKKSEKGFPLVTSRHITSGRLDLSAAYLISELDYKKVNERSNVEYGDILLTMIGTVGVPYLVMDEPANYAIKNIGLFRTSKNLYLKNYLHILLKTDHMQAYLNARVAGTTQKYLSLKVLRNIDFLLPSNIVLEKFNSIVNNMLFKEKSNIDQINQLTKLRDTLLPKLISGELQIPDVATGEKAVD